MNEPTETPKSNAHEFTVSELSRSVKRAVEDEFGHVRVRGEVGRLSRPASGHLYFDLKDDKAVISAVAWKGVASRWRFQPEQGLEVIVTGRMTTFPGQSKYQIIVENVEPAGAGALMALLEERRKKLAAEGLFDAEHKQDLPYLPRTIGVVTSPSGAVIRDILHRLEDRFPTNVIVWPVRVQGETCAPEVAAAVEGFNMLPPEGTIPRPDLLIVARGGGSVEDLWGFNEEAVVRAISESSIPIISAIGHETDTSLADFAADKRAPTPTGAAEMAVPVRSELISYVDDLGTRQRTSVRRIVARARDGLRASAAGLPRPAEIVGEARQRLDIAQTRLAAALGRARQKKALQLAQLAPRLNRRVLLQTIGSHRARIGALPLQAAILRTLGTKRQQLEQNWQLANSLGYRNVLARGFALVSDAQGKLVRSAATLADGDRVSLKFADGDKGAIITGSDAVPLSQKKRGQKKPGKPKKPLSPSDNGQADLF